MVFITTSRGTDEVQLTSNMISSVPKSSRRTSILSTTSSRCPKQVYFLSRIWARRAGIGAPDTHPAGVIPPGQTHQSVNFARGLFLRVGYQRRYANHGGGFAGVSGIPPGLLVALHVFNQNRGSPEVVG